MNTDIDVDDFQDDMPIFAGNQVKSTGDFELITWLSSNIVPAGILRINYCHCVILKEKSNE